MTNIVHDFNWVNNEGPKTGHRCVPCDKQYFIIIITVWEDERTALADESSLLRAFKWWLFLVGELYGVRRSIYVYQSSSQWCRFYKKKRSSFYRRCLDFGMESYKKISHIDKRFQDLYTVRINCNKQLQQHRCCN
jgi:hypothetical protein